METARSLRTEAFSEKMPDDPRSSLPCLWVYKTRLDMEFEISTSPQEVSREERMTMVCFLLWQYRMERGISTPCNHGRSHSRFTRSFASNVGVEGEFPDVDNMLSKTLDSYPPLPASGAIESHRWMSLDWSEWQEMNLGNIKKIPILPGVYRIYDPEELEMLYLGESSNLRGRIQSHLRGDWGSKAVFSYHILPKSLPEYQRMEIENDLIGGYYLERIEAPRFQFKKK